MVTEAQRKSSRCLDAALLALGHLAAVTGVPLNSLELGAQPRGKVTAVNTTTSTVFGKALRSTVIKHQHNNRDIICIDFVTREILEGWGLLH